MLLINRLIRDISLKRVFDALSSHSPPPAQILPLGITRISRKGRLFPTITWVKQVDWISKWTHVTRYDALRQIHFTNSSAKNRIHITDTNAEHMTMQPYSLRRNGTHRQREITRKRFFISQTPWPRSTRFGSGPMRKTPLILSPTSEFSTCFASCTSASTMSRNIGSSPASSSDSARFSMTDGALHTPCGRCYLLRIYLECGSLHQSLVPNFCVNCVSIFVVKLLHHPCPLDTWWIIDDKEKP